jgi:uncharacterized membrane protein
MNKTLKATLLASLILNVLFVGVLLGQLPNRLATGAVFRQRMEGAINELPEPARSRFRQQIEQTRQEVQPLRDQIQEARNEAVRVFVAEKFDEPAYDRQVSKISELRAELAKRMAASVKEAAKDLPSEQRQTLAEAFKRPATASR